MPRSKEDWQHFWRAYLWGGSTMLVLKNLSHKLDVPVEVLKERIQTPTEKEGAKRTKPVDHTKQPVGV